ncbi:MAG: NADH-quinone oxidoreductase subunit C [Candidatus Saganbacteria bacterium]|nr:NADH-quinone oxidoreductase subunit C [Candidatus Saganbacteria bacterium]
MEYQTLLEKIQNKHPSILVGANENCDDEIYIKSTPEKFNELCLALHEELHSPVMSMFAQDLESHFRVYCSFLGIKYKKWFFVTMDIAKDTPQFKSIAKEIYSANLFDREIKELFGIEPLGNPDTRRLRLHDEVWPNGFFPLRKNFVPPKETGTLGEYKFTKVEGDGIFEVPVGPVHAGIIGPGHFRFSVAGEPIINLEIRLGFTHRGIEKLMEGKTVEEALQISECVSGDASFAHSWALCHAIEKIYGLKIPERASYIRAILLELERMYNHVSDIGGIATDVGFSHPSALASIIKELIHQLNIQLTGHRFLKGVNMIGGVTKDIDENKKALLLNVLPIILRDFNELKQILSSSTSFLDRVDTTGMLKKKTAEDFGVLGVAGRASGIAIDLRKNAHPAYVGVDFSPQTAETGDVLARLNIRIQEFEQSANLIQKILGKMTPQSINEKSFSFKEGFALGYVEGWRGPVLYWININKERKIERCKIVDPSFRNWQGLSYAVIENIIPDFPLCNKSFNLSYAGTDL